MSIQLFAPPTPQVAPSLGAYRSAATARSRIHTSPGGSSLGLASLCRAFPGFKVACTVGTDVVAVQEILRLEPDVAPIDGGQSDLAVCEGIRQVRQTGSRTKCAFILGGETGRQCLRLSGAGRVATC